MVLKSNLEFVFDATAKMIVPGDNVLTDKEAAALLTEESVKAFIKAGKLVEVKEEELVEEVPEAPKKGKGKKSKTEDEKPTEGQA